MKVNKHGDLIKKRTHKFKCYNCGCKYTADNGEWYYSESLISAKTNKPTDYVSSKCPECDKTNTVQWRGRLRDWWKKNWEWVLFLVAILMIVLFFLFVGMGYHGLSLISLILSVTLILLSVTH